MTTLTPETLAHTSPAVPLRERLRALRTSPAPEFGRSAADHKRYIGYLGANMVFWTTLGLAGSLALQAMVDALVALGS